MDEIHWHEMNFPKVEVLVLIFNSSEYFLPPFLKSMKIFKILMVFNYAPKRAALKGLDALSYLTELKVVHLERLLYIPIQIHNKELQKLEKLSLSLCEGFGNTLNFSNTNLRVFNLDHCSDLEIFPSSICHIPYAQIWSITNCHLVQNLPYNLGNLVNLRVLSLSALPILKELPASIGNLEQLDYLDISLCDGLRQLPEEIGQLKKLSELDMRECSHLTRLPKSIFGLSSLKHVICDEKIGKQYLQVKSISIPILEVEILETHFSLDWLDD
ncbi:hypothetical protein SUGI_1483910 [Cryptomeria japonica]|uniref:Uncharacterized protein n=1 Tax=Cryptomeria japonica TaxID=3369 RepID=A0AAD3NT27_CRYJA|nr:hypothetical protein SUGI_1483410 [Cryptomeria japonica]GLJ58906.1 hypothetical protein SUGI_1483910 [Cryptomeria japonica]